MNAIGVSLPWDYVSEKFITKDSAAVRDTLGLPADGINFLKGLGVSSIELRHLNAALGHDDMVRAISVLGNSGVNISIHAEDLPKSDNWSVHDILPWIDILENEVVLDQDEIVVAIHPQQSSGNESEDDLRLGTIKIIRMLAELQEGWKRDYRFALENQRYRGLADQGTTFDGIHSMWAGIGSPVVGICWDFGHGIANHIKNNQQCIPSDEFLDATIHTHIHDLGPAGSTHWPFARNVVPLEDFASRLAVHGYCGIYNLELGFDRFAEIDGKRELLVANIDRLSQLLAK